MQVEQSLKYSQAESDAMWAAAGLKEVKKWGAKKEQYSKFVQSLLTPAYLMLLERYQKFLIIVSIILFTFFNYTSIILIFAPKPKIYM